MSIHLTSLTTENDWLSVSDLARERNVSRQTIHERVRKLSANRGLPTRGERKTLRVHAPTFRAMVAEEADPAQALRLRHVVTPREAKAAPEPSPAPLLAVADAESSAQPTETPRYLGTYDEAATREKNARAELAEMEAARRRGELVQAREFEAAAVAVGTRLAQTINALRAQVTPLYAAAQAGEDALHAALNLAIDKALETIADDMTSLAGSGAAETETAAD